METQRSVKNPRGRSRAVLQVPAARPAGYVSPAPLMDVMVEQLRYLVSHGGADCAEGCVECARLAEVRKCLLAPFC